MNPPNRTEAFPADEHGLYRTHERYKPGSLYVAAAQLDIDEHDPVEVTEDPDGRWFRYALPVGWHVIVDYLPWED